MEISTLAARFGAPACLSDFEVHRLGETPVATSLADTLLTFLDIMGHCPESLHDLAAALQGLEDEDDLAWWAVPEGLAVTSASDGWWLLIREADK